MNWSLFLITLLPLVIFVVVDIKAGMRAAVIAALGAAILFLIWSYFTFGRIDEIGLIEVALLGILGAISIKLNNSRFFKFQPVIIGIIIGLFLLYTQLFSEPFLQRMVPMLKQLQPEMAHIYDDPRMLALLSRTSLYLIPVFLLHALLVAYAAVRKSNWFWIGTRVAIYPLIIITMVIAAVMQQGA